MQKVFDSLAEIESGKKKSNLIFTFTVLIIVAIMTAIIILFSTVFFFVKVEGQSMENTLKEGDGLIVNRYAQVERGDIVIIEKTTTKTQRVFPVNGKVSINSFDYPFVEVVSASDAMGRKYTATVTDEYVIVDHSVTTIVYKCSFSIIKRVIALEGDSVKLKDGNVYIKQSGEAEYTKIQEDYVKEPNSTFPSIGFDGYEKPLEQGKVFYLGDNRIKSEDSTEEGCCNIQDVVGVVVPFSLKTKGITKIFFELFSPAESMAK